MDITLSQARKDAMNEQNIYISPPFHNNPSPYGKSLVNSGYSTYYVTRELTQTELDDPKCSRIQQITKSVNLGAIINFDNQPNRFIISQLYPNESFTTLSDAVNFLVANEGQLTFCT